MPRQPKIQTRDKWLQVRCTPQQLIAWNRLARARGVTLSDLARQLLDELVKK